MNHFKILGYVYLVSGIIGILGAAMATAAIYSQTTFFTITPDTQKILIDSGYGSWLLIALWASAILSTGAGVGILRNLPGAKVIVTLLGILSLFSIPIGTAIGIYTLWVLYRNPVKPENGMQ
ncbi:MAG: hypothetical protein JWM56_1248 [Candidatus Peribacteria bacterium]|nr:hypothetical protein [Candidatus Peribacteria bacterium]